MTERLFTPLGMTHSTFRPTEAMTRPLSMGHTPEGTEGDGWPMEVFEKDGRLFLRRFDQELEMTKVGDRRFTVGPPGADRPQEIVFGPDDADGKPIFLHMFVWAFPRAG